MSKTNGITSPCTAPSRPLNCGDGQPNSYMYVSEVVAWALARRIAGIRIHQSVCTAAITSPGPASGYLPQYAASAVSIGSP